MLTALEIGYLNLIQKATEEPVKTHNVGSDICSLSWCWFQTSGTPLDNNFCSMLFLHINWNISVLCGFWICLIILRCVSWMGAYTCVLIHTCYVFLCLNHQVCFIMTYGLHGIKSFCPANQTIVKIDKF